MRTGDQNKVQLIITMFKVLYDLKASDKEIWLYLNTDSPFTLDLDTDCFYRSLEHHNCTKEQFVQLMNIDAAELNKALLKQDQLPPYISKKLGHTNIILELGIDAFGNLDDFLIWMNTPNELFNNKKPIDTLKEVELTWEGEIDEVPSEEDYWESDVKYIELIHIIAEI